MSAAALILDLVHGAISALRGGRPPDLTAEKIAAVVADKVKEAVAATIASELRTHAAALGLVIAGFEIAEAASELLSKMREAEAGGGLPRLLDGADVQVMPASWHPPAEPAAPPTDPAPAPVAPAKDDSQP